MRAKKIYDQVFERIRNSPHEQPEVAFKFFVIYSRFEYALKKAEYFNPDGNIVKINYQKFGDEHAGAFKQLKLTNKGFAKATNYLKNVPPKKQAIRNGKIEWVATQPSGKTELEKILLIIARIRNNCFHGDKFNLFLNESRGRNLALLENALIVIEELLHLSARVENAFYQGL
jgi:hypothetical protein